MSSQLDSLTSILNQVATTTVHINNHADGHFISKAQLEALLALVHNVITPTVSDSEESDELLRTSLALHVAKHKQLDQKIKLESNPVKRTEINFQIGKESSEIARLKRLLK